MKCIKTGIYEFEAYALQTGLLTLNVMEANFHLSRIGWNIMICISVYLNYSKY